MVFTQIGLVSYSQSVFLFCSACAENLRAGRISARNISTHAIAPLALANGMNPKFRYRYQLLTNHHIHWFAQVIAYDHGLCAAQAEVQQ